jgi:hypothetical protein
MKNAALQQFHPPVPMVFMQVFELMRLSLVLQQSCAVGLRLAKA